MYHPEYLEKYTTNEKMFQTKYLWFWGPYCQKFSGDNFTILNRNPIFTVDLDRASIIKYGLSEKLFFRTGGAQH